LLQFNVVSRLLTSVFNLLYDFNLCKLCHCLPSLTALLPIQLISSLISTAYRYMNVYVIQSVMNAMYQMYCVLKLIVELIKFCVYPFLYVFAQCVQFIFHCCQHTLVYFNININLSCLSWLSSVCQQCTLCCHC